MSRVKISELDLILAEAWMTGKIKPIRGKTLTGISQTSREAFADALLKETESFIDKALISILTPD